MAGTYLSMTDGECRDCPENSVGVEPGLVVCPCVEERMTFHAPMINTITGDWGRGWLKYSFAV